MEDLISVEEGTGPDIMVSGRQLFGLENDIEAPCLLYTSDAADE